MFLDKQEITVMGETITLDPQIMEFDETTLTNYLEHEASWFAYYGSKLANAEAEEAWVSIQMDKEYDELFWHLKADGAGSDKFCESKAKSDNKVIEWKKKQVASQRNLTILKMFLKALEKSHDNSRSRGYILQKEMDKLGNDIRRKNNYESELEDLLNKG